MARGDDDDFFNLTEGSLARGPEPSPWAVLSPRSAPPAPRGGLHARLVVLLVVMATVAGALAGAVAGRVRGAPASAQPSLPPVDPVSITPGSVSSLVEQIGPSVVYLSTRSASLPDLLKGTPPPGSVTGVLV